ncbi:MAG: Lrp/AsnC family transcriptional regulator [Mesorhizobium sp.]|nr:MAG: Lrp/AsnC family transcriptional regulator [Mesorhizobium sp.]
MRRILGASAAVLVVLGGCADPELSKIRAINTDRVGEVIEQAKYQLADALGVARGTVQNRLDRLMETGTLLGFTARVREDYDERTVQAVMMIEVVGKSTTHVIRKLRGLPEIVALHTTNGSWDLIGDIRAGSLAEFDRVLREVRMIDGVANSETSLLLSSV